VQFWWTANRSSILFPSYAVLKSELNRANTGRKLEALLLLTPDHPLLTRQRKLSDYSARIILQQVSLHEDDIADGKLVKEILESDRVGTRTEKQRHVKYAK
jgi:hypothetical protein